MRADGWQSGLAELPKGRMRTAIPLLEPALTVLIRDHHRRRLALQLAPIDFLDEPNGRVVPAHQDPVLPESPDESRPHDRYPGLPTGPNPVFPERRG